MKDYERLTNPNLEEYYPKHDFCLGCEHFENHTCKRWNGNCANYEDFNRVYDRLFDLEDKIERGEIDYVADKDKEIARLTEENESLSKPFTDGKCVYLSDSEPAEGCVQSPCPNYKPVEDILKENAELHARLSKAVELKVNVRDTLYMPWKHNGIYEIATLEILEIRVGDEVKYITDIESDDEVFLYKYKCGIFSDEDFDNMVFTDSAKAEARLAELKGGDQE